jgi:superoxide reductase
MSEIYKCKTCGNVVSKMITGGGTLVCCGQPMENQEVKTMAEGTEKHKPVVKILKSKIKIKIGSKPHPMLPEHYIALVSIMKDGKVIAGKRLYPGDKPEVVFSMKDTTGITAFAYCNVHGLWKSE